MIIEWTDIIQGNTCAKVSILGKEGFLPFIKNDNGEPVYHIDTDYIHVRKSDVDTVVLDSKDTAFALFGRKFRAIMIGYNPMDENSWDFVFTDVDEEMYIHWNENKRQNDKMFYSEEEVTKHNENKMRAFEYNKIMMERNGE